MVMTLLQHVGTKIMKLRYLIVMLPFIGHSNVMASTQDYKCYIQLANQSYQIAFVDGSKATSALQAEQQLFKQGFYADDGKQLQKPKKIIECQKMNVSFVDNKANLADERTPR